MQTICRIKQLVWVSIICLFLMSASILFMPIANIKATQTNSISLIVVGGLFWAFLFTGYVLLVRANVNGVISEMDALLQQVQSEWEGAASESYTARYQELKPGFMKAEELIREIAAALDSTAKIDEETDSEIANQFKK